MLAVPGSCCHVPGLSLVSSLIIVCAANSTRQCSCTLVKLALFVGSATCYVNQLSPSALVAMKVLLLPLLLNSERDPIMKAGWFWQLLP